jgi:hypothetical protein
MATWTGQGIGRFTSAGKIRFIGSLFYSTSSNGKLAFFNNLVRVFEYEADKQGNTSAKVWELAAVVVRDHIVSHILHPFFQVTTQNETEYTTFLE